MFGPREQALAAAANRRIEKAAPFSLCSAWILATWQDAMLVVCEAQKSSPSCGGKDNPPGTALLRMESLSFHDLSDGLLAQSKAGVSREEDGCSGRSFAP